MIPKVIHYCWFGGNPLTPLAKKCIESWKKNCPDYEIREWNESNFDIHQNDYVREAYEMKKWAFVTDYVRLKVLYDYGGIYMDTDVEVVKPLDSWLSYDAVSGFESETYIPTGTMMAVKGNEWIKILLEDYDDRHFVLPDGTLDLTTNVKVITDITRYIYGIRLNNERQIFGNNMLMLPFDYFCAKSYETGKIMRTDNTYTIHHFSGSWEDEMEKNERKWKNNLSIILGDRGAGILAQCLVIYKKHGITRLVKKVLWKIVRKFIPTWMIYACMEGVLPVKKGLIVFISYDGKYEDSPRKIFESMSRLVEADYVWLVHPENLDKVPRNARRVPINSFQAAILRGRAQVIVDNVYGGKVAVQIREGIRERFNFWINCIKHRKKMQRTYSTWHGTPLKKMGRDQINAHEIRFSCGNVTMLFDNRYVLDIMRHLTYDKMRMLMMGAPRNDALYNLSMKDRENTKEALGLSRKKKVLLFAPTFRSDGRDGVSQKNIQRSGIKQLEMMDIDRLLHVLQQKFGGEWVLALRFHYHVADLVNWHGLRAKFRGRIINGNVHEMEDWMKCADVMITDISSCMFDFSVTKRPCFLFFPDEEYYVSSERGTLYMELRELPFPLANTFDELIDNIETFAQDDYHENICEMRRRMGYVEIENAADKIAEFILRENELL